MDLSAFLAAREPISDEQLLKFSRLVRRFGNIMWEAILLMPILGKSLRFIGGLSGVYGSPESAAELDMMEWNQKNYDYHVLIAGFLIPGGASRAKQLIEEHRLTALTKGPQSTEARPQESSPSGIRSTEVRLREIEDLLAKKLITEEEYRLKRKEILSGV